MSKRTHNSPKLAALMKRDKGVMSKIIAQFTSRTRIDIKAWRDALAEAEQDRYPKRVKWAKAVKDLDLDAHWTSQVLIRKLSVMRKPFIVRDKKTKKANPEKTSIFQAPWFYQLMKAGLDAKMYGTQVVEIQTLLAGDYSREAVYRVPQLHVAPEAKTILMRESDSIGYVYADDPYILEFPEDSLLGLLYKAAPHIIWKKNAQQSWAEFLEKFGIPMRYATTNKKDKATLDKIEKMLDELGSAARALFPEGTVIDFKEANTQDAFKVFDQMMERCNSEISKLVNGVTMISDNGSSLSQSQVHEKINNKIIEGDCADWESTVQWYIMPRLQQLGFNINPQTDEWVFDNTEQLTKGAMWNIVQGILKFHEVDEQWLTETFGVPLTGKRAAPIMDNQSGGNIPNNMEDLTKVIMQVMKSEPVTFNPARQSAAPAGQRFDHAAYSKMLKAHSPLSSGEGLGGEVKNSINSLFLKAAQAFFDNPTNKPATLSSGEWNDLYKEVADKLWKGVNNAYQDAANIDLDTVDIDMLNALQNNMYVFSAFKNFNLMLALNGELKDENGKLREWADFKTKALALNEEYNVNWLQTEYNTAIASAQGAAQWQLFWNERNDYNLKFQTVGDKRVRDEHQLLDGIVRPVDDDFWNTHYPPLAFNCRCEAIQVDKSEPETDKSKIASVEVPKMFRNNVGKSGQVFTKDHPYWAGLTTTEKNALEKLANDTLEEDE